MNDPSNIQVAAVVASLLAAGISALVKRSVSQQDRKLDTLAVKLDAVNEKVGDHATKLAEGAAEMRELSRRAGELERKVDHIAISGCALKAREGCGT